MFFVLLVYPPLQLHLFFSALPEIQFHKFHRFILPWLVFTSHTNYQIENILCLKSFKAHLTTQTTICTMAGSVFVSHTVDLLWTHTKYLKITWDECAISLIHGWCTQSCGLDCNLKWGLNSTPHNKKSIYHTVWRGDLLSTVAKASHSSATSLTQIESQSHSQTHTHTHT